MKQAANDSRLPDPAPFSTSEEIRKRELDTRIVELTQAGFEPVTTVYESLADRLGINEAELLERLRAMRADGRIRRIGVVPNHFRLGYTANGMSVWDVDDNDVQSVGRQIGALESVSHCYQRPRVLPQWPYNLFAMVHGKTREEVSAEVERIAALLGTRSRAYDVLFSIRILKKTGLRFGGR